MKTKLFIGLLVIAVLISGCTTTTTTRPAEQQTPATTTPAPTLTPEETMPSQVNVAIENSAFVPDIVEISKGTTVIWTNDDGVQHTVTSISGTFDSGNIDSGKTFSYTFNQAGPFEYSCVNHPNMTHGKVIVT